jgi:hypothetical protein
MTRWLNHEVIVSCHTMISLDGILITPSQEQVAEPYIPTLVDFHVEKHS